MMRQLFPNLPQEPMMMLRVSIILMRDSTNSILLLLGGLLGILAHVHDTFRVCVLEFIGEELEERALGSSQAPTQSVRKRPFGDR